MNSATKKGQVTKQERILMWKLNAETPKPDNWSSSTPCVVVWHGWDIKFRQCASYYKPKDKMVEETMTGMNGSATDKYK